MQQNEKLTLFYMLIKGNITDFFIFTNGKPTCDDFLSVQRFKPIEFFDSIYSSWILKSLLKQAWHVTCDIFLNKYRLLTFNFCQESIHGVKVYFFQMKQLKSPWKDSWQNLNTPFYSESHPLFQRWIPQLIQMFAKLCKSMLA